MRPGEDIIQPGEPRCPNGSCRHGRRQHSRNGCIYMDPQTGEECKCKKTYNELR